MDNKKNHGNTGNSHAMKETETRSSIINFRCTAENKTAWVRAAQLDGGKKLSQWITDKLNA